jgi:hypothetical protein
MVVEGCLMDELLPALIAAELELLPLGAVLPTLIKISRPI